MSSCCLSARLVHFYLISLFFFLSFFKKKKKLNCCETGRGAATKVTGMKDDAPTRPLAHVKYVREKTRKQNECESVGSDVTGVFRGFSRLCFSYLLRACVRVVCVCVCVVVALCTELYLRIEFLLFSPFLPPSADHPALAPVDCC